MKSKSKKMVAALTTALNEAALVKSGGKKIVKRINDTAKKIVRKINKRIDTATQHIPKKVIAKEQKQAIKIQKKLAVAIPARETT
ncbi:hypothetical protein [Flavobacterium sp.]|uniref:hypothetical protein n=1 Tax=Flavobacterium sp. TaxID=239 RepID=UPI00262BED70|nr:hypothetical protein [Flavobacterium sp.]